MINIRNGSFRLELDNYNDIIERRSLESKGNAQRYVDSEVLRLCTPKVPLDSGELIRSGIRETKIGSGRVIYQTPYARKWYYTPANFFGAPIRGNYWFERMKNEGGLKSILKGVAKITGGKSK